MTPQEIDAGEREYDRIALDVREADFACVLAARDLLRAIDESPMEPRPSADLLDLLRRCVERSERLRDERNALGDRLMEAVRGPIPAPVGPTA